MIKSNCVTRWFLSLATVALFAIGCDPKTNISTTSRPFISVQSKGDIQVTLLSVERRTVFLRTNQSPPVTRFAESIHGLAVAYAVEPVREGITNEPVLSFDDILILEKGKPKLLPTPKDVPSGFNPRSYRSFWFAEYKETHYPHSTLPTVKNPSNAVVYLSEQYGIHITNKSLTLAIRAMLPGDKHEIFIFNGVPFN